MEHRASTNEGDQVRCVHGPPPGLRGVDQLVGHGNSRGTRSGALGDLSAQPDGGEGRLDGVGGAQVDPVLGGVLIELQQGVGIVDDLGDRLWGILRRNRPPRL